MPDSARVAIIDPHGASTTYTHGTDAELVNAEAGSYYIDITPNKPGLWRYAFISDGNGQAMDEGAFFVRDSPSMGARTGGEKWPTTGRRADTGRTPRYFTSAVAYARQPYKAAGQQRRYSNNPLLSSIREDNR